MASTSTKNTTFIPDLEDASERLRESSDRLLEVSRKVTEAYLDGIERYVAGVVKFERTLGEQTQVEPVATILGAHAKLTEDLVGAGVSAARELVVH